MAAMAVALAAMVAPGLSFSILPPGAGAGAVGFHPAVISPRPGVVLLARRRRAGGLTCQAERSPYPDQREQAPAWRLLLRAVPFAAASLALPLAATAADGSGFRESLIQGMIAGAVAGAAVDLVLYPIDTVKTRLQTDSMKVVDMEALPALYSGVVGSLAGHVPSSALFFAVYQTAKVFWLEPAYGEGALAAQLLASALGNIAASTIRVPTEVVKTRIQVLQTIAAIHTRPHPLPHPFDAHFWVTFAPPRWYAIVPVLRVSRGLTLQRWWGRVEARSPSRNAVRISSPRCYIISS